MIKKILLREYAYLTNQRPWRKYVGGFFFIALSLNLIVNLITFPLISIITPFLFAASIIMVIFQILTTVLYFKNPILNDVPNKIQYQLLFYVVHSIWNRILIFLILFVVSSFFLSYFNIIIMQYLFFFAFGYILFCTLTVKETMLSIINIRLLDESKEE